MPRFRAFKGTASVADASLSEDLVTNPDGSRVISLVRVDEQLPPCESMELKSIADSVDLQADFVDPRFKFKSDLDFSFSGGSSASVPNETIPTEKKGE